jgi:hypothetical protein
MTSDERQLASMPDEAPPGPQHWKRRLQVVLTLCAYVLVVGFGVAVGLGLNSQLTGMLQPVLQAVYLVLFFVTTLPGFEIFMVVGFVLAVRAMRLNLALRRGNPGYGRSFAWGSRLALAGLVPLVVGCSWFWWNAPDLLEGWRPPNNVFVGFFALLGAALVLFCIGIVLICVAFIWAIWQRVRSVVRGPSGNSDA